MIPMTVEGLRACVNDPRFRATDTLEKNAVGNLVVLRNGVVWASIDLLEAKIKEFLSAAGFR